MFDKLIEKGQMLASLGSFWSKTLEDDASYVPHKLTHLPFITQVLGKFSTICRIALGQGRISTGQYVIRFSDSDIQGNILLIDQDTMVTSVYQDDSIIARMLNSSPGTVLSNLKRIPGHYSLKCVCK